MLKIYDSTHQSSVLLPEIYAGMTKEELYAALKQYYSALYGGKVLENPLVREGADKLLDYQNYALTTFRAYSDSNYCCRISYQGSSSHTLFNVLKHVK